MAAFVREALHTKPAQEEHLFWSLETKFENIRIGTSFNTFRKRKTRPIWANILRMRRNNCLIKKRNNWSWTKYGGYIIKFLFLPQVWKETGNGLIRPVWVHLPNVFCSFHSLKYKTESGEQRIHTRSAVRRNTRNARQLTECWGQRGKLGKIIVILKAHTEK